MKLQLNATSVPDADSSIQYPLRILASRWVQGGFKTGAVSEYVEVGYANATSVQ